MSFFKRLAAVFICAAMAAAALPAFAAGGAETTFETRVTSDAQTDNDELFASYVNQIFYGATGFTLFGNYGESLFSGTDLEIYNEMKSQIQSIAAGESNSTVVTVSNINWTYEELGLTSPADGNAVAEAIYTKLNLVIDCLFVDCPYDFYWCNKSEEGISLYMLRYETYALISIEVTYYAAEDYKDGSDTSVNPEKVTTAKKAAENALEIVAENEGKTDREKLAAYREAICSLVEYDKDSANGIVDGTVAYGDPWQMIYVFDGDEDTNVVCEGYSKAFQYLCDMSEFDSATCYIVTGTVDGGSHMWNVVTLDGVNYFCDVTNSDVLSTDLFFDASEVASSSSLGYTVKIRSLTAKYLYDDATLSLYSSDILTLGTRVQGVTLSESDITLGEGDEMALEASFEPENATNQNVTWCSSDESVATVEDGVVTAIS
ncbi:MAG: Ig-like domain-containing protein, partial [Clostridia bacterium]|nr:Ig-like domain-containing protein [Clostridia bacterium]